MSLKTKRYVFRPLEYQQAFDFFVTQSNSFWLPTEVSMETDILDWKSKLTEAEKDVVINTLRLFTQMEIAVQDNFWNIVPKLFKKPEVSMMSAGFSNMESIHTWGYSYLNDSLKLPESEFSTFLQEPTMKAKLDYFCQKRSNVPLFLATLTFLEGVSLFSSFVVLANFSRFNKLKGVQQIISYSALDEGLHANASAWLFNEYKKDYPKEFNPELGEEIKEMARTVVALEDDYVDRIFKLAPNGIEGLSPAQVKQYVRFRANDKLIDLGMKPMYNKVKTHELDWWSAMLGGVSRVDFFSQRNSSYALGKLSFDEVEF